MFLEFNNLTDFGNHLLNNKVSEAFVSHLRSDWDAKGFKSRRVLFTARVNDYIVLCLEFYVDDTKTTYDKFLERLTSVGIEVKSGRWIGVQPPILNKGLLSDDVAESLEREFEKRQFNEREAWEKEAKEKESQTTSKQPWQVENERRTEIASLIKNLTSEQLAVFVSDRYGLRSNDPWVVSLVKTRDSIGRDAAITMIRNRDVPMND